MNNHQLTDATISQWEAEVSRYCHGDSRKARSFVESLYIKHKSLIEQVLKSPDPTVKINLLISFFQKRLWSTFLQDTVRSYALLKTVDDGYQDSRDSDRVIRKVENLAQGNSPETDGNDIRGILSFLASALKLKPKWVTPGLKSDGYVMWWYPQQQFQVEIDPNSGSRVLFTSQWADKQPLAIIKPSADRSILYTFANVYTQSVAGFHDFVTYSEGIPLIDDKWNSLLPKAWSV